MTAIYTNLTMRFIRKFTNGKIFGSKLGTWIMTAVNIWTLVEVVKMLGA